MPCKHCGRPDPDNACFFRSHDDHPYCCVSDRKGDVRLIPGTPYVTKKEAK